MPESDRTFWHGADDYLDYRSQSIWNPVPSLTSLGLLLSTLTSNQIVAAVASLTLNLLIVAVPLMGASWSFAPLQPVLDKISITAHFAGSFSRGILDSSVLIFYAGSTLGLLVIATRTLELRRWR